MTSSVRAKMIQVIKQEKVAQREKENAPEMVRARNDSGHYIADDPKTPQNEAWVKDTEAAMSILEKVKKPSVVQKKVILKKKVKKS